MGIYQPPKQDPYFRLLFFYSSQGGGGGGGRWAFVPLRLSYPSVSAELGFVNLESKRGSEAIEWGEGVGGVSPCHGRDFYVVDNSCMKTTIFLHIFNAIIKGVGYVRCHIYTIHCPLPLIHVSFPPVKGSKGSYAPN